MPIAASPMKIARQPSVSETAVPISGATPGPRMTIRFIVASRRVESAMPEPSRTIARPRTSPAQPPSACRSRVAISASALGVRAAAMLVRV